MKNIKIEMIDIKQNEEYEKNSESLRNNMEWLVREKKAFMTGQPVGSTDSNVLKKSMTITQSGRCY